MPLSMSQIALPAFERGLTAFAAVLTKSEQHPGFAKIEPALLQARLFPDMFHFTRQVQIAADFAKGTTARLSGVEPPSYPDDEASFADLRARLERTLAFVRSIPAERIDGSERRVVTLKTGGREMTFEGQPYLMRFALPNFYFHLATAYDILRHNGIALGKRDFIGEF